jgi:hypothetical protein
MSFGISMQCDKDEVATIFDIYQEEDFSWASPQEESRSWDFLWERAGFKKGLLTRISSAYILAIQLILTKAE